MRSWYRRRTLVSVAQYYWLCPDVRCPAVSEGCQTIEYIVFRYNYQVRGRTVNVRCESCEYCLDAPSHATTRRRRFARQNSTLSTSARSSVSVISKRSCIVETEPSSCRGGRPWRSKSPNTTPLWGKVSLSDSVCKSEVVVPLW